MLFVTQKQPTSIAIGWAHEFAGALAPAEVQRLSRGTFSSTDVRPHRGAILLRMSGYWKVVEPFWDLINIYDGPEVFRSTYDSAPKISGLMFAAHFCQSEVCNGGFGQFFSNSTGVLAPEAVEGFRQIGQPQVAAVVESAMELLGPAYPRDRDEREERVPHLPKGALGRSR